jgi:hypothetical protein
MRLLILLAGAAAAAVVSAPGSHAEPGCGPGVGAFWYPMVQSCQVVVPGLGGIGRLPGGTETDQTVPYPVRPPVPFYPANP